MQSAFCVEARDSHWQRVSRCPIHLQVGGCHDRPVVVMDDPAHGKRAIGHLETAALFTRADVEAAQCLCEGSRDLSVRGAAVIRRRHRWVRFGESVGLQGGVR